jgi:hypothetical protein
MITVGGLCNVSESGGVIGLLLRSCMRLLSLPAAKYVVVFTYSLRPTDPVVPIP